mmetsp:Transcript_31342/g.58443  ORF Transcript_31342/g.58443 Transcript_31342/m.58443 type:complete len:97 (-) Transcript_31342:505-795(-)
MVRMYIDQRRGQDRSIEAAKCDHVIVNRFGRVWRKFDPKSLEQCSTGHIYYIYGQRYTLLKRQPFYYKQNSDSTALSGVKRIGEGKSSTTFLQCLV